MRRTHSFFKRSLKPNGLAYITIHDRHTIDLVNAGYHYDPTGYFANKDRIETELRNAVNSNPVYQKQKNDFGMLVIDRNSNLNVFNNEPVAKLRWRAELFDFAA